MSIRPLVLDYQDASAIPGPGFRKLIDENQLVLLNNVDFRSKLDLIKFATTVGNPLRYSMVNSNNRSFNSIEDSLVRTVTYNLNNVEINNDKKYTGRAAWHIDSKWTEPQIHIRYNILYGKKVPADPTVGNTIYSHTGLMLDSMPEDRKQYLRTLTIKHVRSKISFMYENGYVGRNINDINDDFYIRSEPLIQQDENGREFMYLSEQDAWCINGIPTEQSTDLIKQLAYEIRTTSYQYRHQWKPNQLVISVNPVFPHVVTDDFDTDLREMWRIWIK